MARKKKLVDGTPIFAPACLRRIDPMWMPGRVPKHSWEDQTHRRATAGGAAGIGLRPALPAALTLPRPGNTMGFHRRSAIPNQ